MRATLAQAFRRHGLHTYSVLMDASIIATPAFPPALEGARVRLRAHRDDDLADLHAVHSDPAVMRYWSTPAWTELERSRERLAKAKAGNNPDACLAWAIARRDDDRLIGGVTVFGIDRAQGRAEVGYALHSSAWGRGYAQEALRLALPYAFNALGLRRIEADIDPRNLASRRLVERLGFAREGTLRERWCVAGELQDTALYGLLAREFVTAAD